MELFLLLKVVYKTESLSYLIVFKISHKENISGHFNFYLIYRKKLRGADFKLTGKLLSPNAKVSGELKINY